MDMDLALLGRVKELIARSGSRFRTGTVTSVDTEAGTVAAMVGGAVVPRIPYAAGMTPAPGEIVWLLQQAETILAFAQPAAGSVTTTRYYPSVWTGAYRGNGTRRTDSTAALWQGYFSDALGNQRSVARFPVEQIVADLDGGTVESIELLTDAWWFGPAGGTLVIGTHELAGTSAPSTLTTFDDDLQRYGWLAKTGVRSIPLDAAIVTALIDGPATGLVFGPGPTTNREGFFGYLPAKGLPGEPVLKVVAS